MARGIDGEEVYQPQVAAEDLPRKIQPRMETVPVGQGFENAFSAIDQKYKADSATWAGNQLAAFRQKAVQDLQDAQQKAPAGDPGEFTPQYLSNFDKSAASLAASPDVQKNPYASRMINQGLFDLRNTMGQASLNWEATQRKASQLDSITQNLNDQLPLVRQHPELENQIGSTLIDQINSTIMDPDVKQKLVRQVGTGLVRSAALGKVDKDPGGVYQQLQMDQPTDDVLAHLTDPATRQEVTEAATRGLVNQFAGGVLDQYRQGGPAAGAKGYAAVDNLTVDKDPIKNDQIKDEVRRTIQQQRGELIAEQQQKFGPQVMALEESLKRGQPDPTRRGQIWAGYRNNWIGPEQAGAMLGEDDRLNAKGVEDNAGLKLIDDAYNGKYFLDPKDPDEKKDANNWFNAKVDAAGMQQGTQEWQNLGAEFAHRTGIVPQPVMDWSRATLVSAADPQQAYNAAVAVDRMRSASPRGFEYADDDHRLGTIADSILRLTKAGMSVPDAVTTARQNFARGEGEASTLDKQWYAAKPFGKDDTALDAVLTQQVKEDPALTKPGFLWGTNPLPHPPAMQADYETLVRANFNHNGGNLAQAEADAARDIGTKWGITRMNGDPELVKYPPERMFRAADGGPGLSADDIRADIEQQIKRPELKGSFVHYDAEQRKNVPFDPVASNVHLVNMPGVTEQSGGRVWQLMYTDESGTPEVLYDQHHQPLRYELPVRRQDYANLKTQQLADARAAAFKRLQDQNAQEADAQRQLMEDQNPLMFPGTKH